MGWEKFLFGQLYLDGKPQHVPIDPTDKGDIPSYQNEQTISIMDANDDNAITWVKPDGMNLFVADRVLLNQIGWDNLCDAGFVQGKKVHINGLPYRCRLMLVHKQNKDTSEWDEIVDATTDFDGVWHWKNVYFWGTDDMCSPAGYSVRGYNLAKGYYYYAGYIKKTFIGFRPVLEPLAADKLPSGKTIILDGQRFMVSQLQRTAEGIFYPQLMPLEATLFKGIADGSKIRMYTLLCDGEPVQQNTAIILPKAKQMAAVELTLTDKYYGDEFLIPWVISNGIAIADKAVLRGVHPRALKLQGLLK